VLLLGKRMVPLRTGSAISTCQISEGRPTPIPLSKAALIGKASSHLARAARLAPVESRSDAICLGNPVQRNRIVGIEDDDGIAVSIHHHRLH
jgi:hypothetical protein